MMKIAEAQDKATLKKFRPYIENAKVILVDLEGDQLGPNGTITYIQINTFDTTRDSWYCTKDLLVIKYVTPRRKLF